MLWLSAEHVVALHDALITRWGGEEGGGHRGSAYEGAEAAVQAVKNSYYESAMELAAAYAVYIVQGHVFQDGNKRTGAGAMLLFLEVNALSVDTSDARIQELMIELQERAEDGERTDALVAWIVEEMAMRPRKRTSKSMIGRTSVSKRASKRR